MRGQKWLRPPSPPIRWSQQPVRDFKFRSAFGLSFADLSPIVGIYTVFAIGLIAAGPAFLWAFPLVLIGQLMVCGVFGNLVSKWPLQGSVYAWSRELIGPRYGWFTGWAYMWGLTLTLAVLPITAAPYILGAAGVNAPSQIVVELVGHRGPAVRLDRQRARRAAAAGPDLHRAGL